MSQPIPENLRTSPAMIYVTQKGWAWRGGDSGQIQLEVCPFCKSSDWKFYLAVMNPEEGTRDGLYFCHKSACNKTGNLRVLQEHMGDRIAGVESRNEWAGKTDRKVDALPDVEVCHAALLGDAEAVDYLLNVRGFSMEVIKRQKLGLKDKVYFREAGNVRALVLPYLVNGNVVFAKYRTMPPSPKDFISPTGWEAPLYNGEIMVDGLHEVVFVEGEADCLSCLSNGVENVVGVPGAGVKKASWIEALDRIAPEKIYVLYDSDRAGQKGAQELASRIGVEKCLRIALPLGNKDINEWFVKGGTLEQFEELKRNAQLFDITGVTSSGDALQQLEDELAGKVDLAPKYVTQWPSLNRLVGMEEGDVLDILAPEKVGKTTFGLNLIDHMCSAYGEDGLIVCLEMTSTRLARKWVSMVTGFDDTITTPGTPESKAKLEELKAACIVAREIQRGREADLFFAYPQAYKTPEDIYALIRNCVRRYGIKWCMLDNLQLLCDSTLENKGHRTIHLSQISKGLAKIAKDHRINMIRILQPRQIEDGSLVQSRHVDGSSQIVKDTDALISLWRSQTGTTKKSEWESGRGEEGEASFDPKIKVTVALSRYSSGGSCSLRFDGARSQVREPDPNQRMNIAAKVNYNSTIPGIPMEGTPVIQSEQGEI
jgi:replicative DNA helicase/5S rRNA maturation endonuclease (ribonuclease M5)